MGRGQKTFKFSGLTYQGVLTLCAMLLDLLVEWIGLTGIGAPSGMAEGIVILNKVPISFLASR